MEQYEKLESDNINELWLKSVFESLKNLEIMERNARDGCQNILEYMQMPIEYRLTQVANVQYANLKFMISEFSLLIKKLRPILKEEYVKKLVVSSKRMLKISQNKNVFIKDIKRGGVIYANTTSSFDEALEILSNQISDIIKEIEELLYIKDKGDNKKRW